MSNSENTIRPASLARRLQALMVVAGMTILAPTIGALFAERSLNAYLEFPPRTIFLHHAPFSLPAFVGLASVLGLLLVIIIILLRLSGAAPIRDLPATVTRLPWWGIFAAAGVPLFWAVAWTRIPALSIFQLHTFLPLWLSYILLVHALSYRKSGRSPLTTHGVPYSILFLASACFWWIFEYLNRFVQNWAYENTTDFTALEYFLLATLSFATVLPAVHGTKALLDAYAGFSRFRAFPAIDLFGPPLRRALLTAISLLTLAAVPLFPNLLYPCIWLSPLFLIGATFECYGVPSSLTRLRSGDWSGVLCWAASALICGFFWELWNYYSFARWIYHVPYVDTLRIFEMPLLGYAGYLPFGVVCGLVVEALFPDLGNKGGTSHKLRKTDTGSENTPQSGHGTDVHAIPASRLPHHVAIIMDGNGRWAHTRGLSRSEGHRAGLQTVRQVVEAAARFHIRYLTLFAFSTENWRRPQSEVNLLMSFLDRYLRAETDFLTSHGIRLRGMGDISQLPDSVRHALKIAEYRTRHGRKMELIIALSYGGRAEILSACQQIAAAVEDGLYHSSAIDEALFQKHLYASEIPDPDLIIRTSNEFRLSNFMLWQLAYSEIVVQSVFWPDYTAEHLLAALQEYSRRERRFGILPQETTDSHSPLGAQAQLCR